jgi:hypothetical protein
MASSSERGAKVETAAKLRGGPHRSARVRARSRGGHRGKSKLPYNMNPSIKHSNRSPHAKLLKRKAKNVIEFKEYA